MSYLIRTCTACGSTVEAPSREDALLIVAAYDLSCCDGIVPNVSDLS